MKKIVRLTENDLVTIIKKVLNEQVLNRGGVEEEERYDYKQENAHTLLAKDGKKFFLPAGNIWLHQCWSAQESDWLEDQKYNIVFHCGDLDGEDLDPFSTKKQMNLKNFKGSEALVSRLKKEYCLNNAWNNTPTSKRPGCYIQGSWANVGHKY